MKAKEALVRRSVFPKPPPNSVELLIIPYRSVHSKITEEVIAQVLMIQAITKALGPDKINFQA